MSIQIPFGGTFGLRPGMTVAHAQALAPGLTVAEATPEEDNEGLARLARWCLCYAPVVAAILGSTPAGYRDYIEAELVRWAAVVKESGAKAE